MSNTRMLLLGRKAELDEKNSALAEQIKTFRQAIIENLVLPTDPEEMDVQNLRVNVVALERLHIDYMKNHADIKKLKDELGL